MAIPGAIVAGFGLTQGLGDAISRGQNSAFARMDRLTTLKMQQQQNELQMQQMNQLITQNRYINEILERELRPKGKKPADGADAQRAGVKALTYKPGLAPGSSIQSKLMADLAARGFPQNPPPNPHVAAEPASVAGMHTVVNGGFAGPVPGGLSAPGEIMQRALGDMTAPDGMLRPRGGLSPEVERLSRVYNGTYLGDYDPRVAGIFRRGTGDMSHEMLRDRIEQINSRYSGAFATPQPQLQPQLQPQSQSPFGPSLSQLMQGLDPDAQARLMLSSFGQQDNLLGL